MSELMCLLLQLKSWGTSGAFRQPSRFYGQLSDYQSHVLALSTQQMSSLYFISWCYCVRTRGEPKNLSCWFCVWCKSGQLGSRGSPRFPHVTPVMESFSSNLIRAIINYWAESHLEPCQTSTMELSWENNQRL